MINILCVHGQTSVTFTIMGIKHPEVGKVHWYIFCEGFGHVWANACHSWWNAIKADDGELLALLEIPRDAAPRTPSIPDVTIDHVKAIIGFTYQARFPNGPPFCQQVISQLKVVRKTQGL